MRDPTACSARSSPASSSQKIAEDERTLSFMDINPATRGHALVIPKEHTANLLEIDPDDLAAVARAVQRLAQRIPERLGADGINLLNSCGAAAWQTVFHFHIHVIPRYDDDPLRLPWTPAPVTPTRSRPPPSSCDELGAGRCRRGAGRLRGRHLRLPPVNPTTPPFAAGLEEAIGELERPHRGRSCSAEGAWSWRRRRLASPRARRPAEAADLRGAGGGGPARSPGCRARPCVRRPRAVRLTPNGGGALAWHLSIPPPSRPPSGSSRR